MKRIVITESQFDRLIKSEVKDIKQTEVLEEGFKEIALSIALLAGVSLGGNKALAQKSLNKKDIQNKIEYVLNDSDLLNTTIDSLESMGYGDAERKIYSNAEKIKKELKNPLRKVTKKEVKDYQTLTKKLKAGYAISGIQQDTLKKKIESYPEIQPIIDVYEINLPSDNVFGTGLFGSSKEINDTVKNVLNQIKSNDGVILNITIESSTDTEPIKMGNQKLAQLRAQGVVDVLTDLGVDSNIVNIVTKPEQGPDIYNPNMSSQERRDARQQTAPFRYVDIKIEAVKVLDEAPQLIPIVDEVDVIVNTFELVKTKKNDVDFDLPQIKINKKYKQPKLKKCNKVGCTL
jgi:outer membrane protein OmpA-like peptidoglycan-associated protein